MFTSINQHSLHVNIQKVNHIDDHDLLKNFYNDHNNEWLGILLPRYTMVLLGVCMKYLKNEEDAKDCVQQIFLKAIGELHKYKVEYFKSWIYMIAKNHCLMKLRDKGRFVQELTENIAVYEEERKSQLLEKDRSLDRIQFALSNLNKEQKQCVTLFYLEKKSYSEITQLTGFSMLQVKSHLQNGKRNMKIFLSGKDE